MSCNADKRPRYSWQSGCEVSQCLGSSISSLEMHSEKGVDVSVSFLPRFSPTVFHRQGINIRHCELLAPRKNHFAIIPMHCRVGDAVLYWLCQQRYKFVA